MMNRRRRLLFFAIALIGAVGLLTLLLLLAARPPRPPSEQISTLRPTLPAVALVGDEPITRKEWEQAVALDQAMSTLIGQRPPGPEETLNRLINERLVLQQAEDNAILEEDRAQAESWLRDFLVRWNLDEEDLEQVLVKAGLSQTELLEEIIPRLLRVERALNSLPPEGDAEAWVAQLRDQTQVEVLENLAPASSPPPTTPQDAAPTSRVGESAPEFSLPTVDGQTLRLSDLRGRPVLLNFWATWCAPCRTELSLLQALSPTNDEILNDLQIWAINVRESRQEVNAFASDLGLELPLLLDQQGQVSDAYQVYGLPVSLFIDRNGLIVARHVGPLDQRTLEDYLYLFTETAEP